MNRRRETGIAVAWTRSDSSYACRPDQYSKLRDAWMSGKAFVELDTIHGDTFVLKLGTVEAIQLFTPEGMAFAREEAAADKADDAITGA